MGRPRGGLTSKIHALVNGNGLPVAGRSFTPRSRLALTPGETHDNRLAGKLLSRLKSGSMLLADRGYDADWIRALVRQRSAWANILPKRIEQRRCASVLIFTRLATWSSGSLTRSSTAGVCQHATTNSRPTISHSSSLHQYAYGCANESAS